MRVRQSFELYFMFHEYFMDTKAQRRAKTGRHGGQMVFEVACYSCCRTTPFATYDLTTPCSNPTSESKRADPHSPH